MQNWYLLASYVEFALELAIDRLRIFISLILQFGPAPAYRSECFCSAFMTSTPGFNHLFNKPAGKKKMNECVRDREGPKSLMPYSEALHRPAGRLGQPLRRLPQGQGLPQGHDFLFFFGCHYRKAIKRPSYLSSLHCLYTQVGTYLNDFPLPFMRT